MCAYVNTELNKLSDLRGSFHHLTIQITDPEWKQEELPQKLIKVEPDEVSCSISWCASHGKGIRKNIKIKKMLSFSTFVRLSTAAQSQSFK